MSDIQALTVKQVAERLAVGVQVVYKLIHGGQLVGRRIGGNIRVLESDLLLYLNAQVIQPAGGTPSPQPAVKSKLPLGRKWKYFP